MFLSRWSLTDVPKSLLLILCGFRVGNIHSEGCILEVEYVTEEDCLLECLTPY